MLQTILTKVLVSTILILFASTAYAQEKAFPAYAIGNPKAENKIEVYLSATCTDCAVTFTNSVLSLMNQANKRDDLYLFVALVPSSQTDLKFVRVLSCVPQNQFIPYMIEWYLSRRSASADINRLLAMGKNRQILGSTEAECTNDTNDRALVSFNRLVFQENAVTRVPAVFINGKYVADTFYMWQFEKILPQLVRR